MKAERRKFTSAFKAQVAIEALKERESLAKLAKRFEVHPNIISKWKQEFISRSSEIFETQPPEVTLEAEQEKLHAPIGKLKVENEKISIRHQCELMEVSRSTVYYESVVESEENLKIMRLTNENYLEHPTVGVLQMQDFLFLFGFLVNHNRVRRLLLKMGVMAIDNIFIERLWRTVKQDYVFLYQAENGSELYSGLNFFFIYYNTRKSHQGIGSPKNRSNLDR